MEQSRFNQLKNLRENVEWEVEGKRRDFLRRVEALMENWEDDDLPNLQDIFQLAEIELLLDDVINPFVNFSRDPGRTFIDFLVRSGYVADEPVEVEHRNRGAAVRPLLRRATPLHRLFKCYMWLRDLSQMCDQLDWICHRLLKIYARYEFDYVDEAIGVTHFHLACCCRCASNDDQLRIVERFLELGQDPNRVVAKTGDSPLHLALIMNNGEAVPLLLKAGADPNLATRDGDTPLHIVSSSYVPGAGLAETFFRACDESSRLVRVDARNNSGDTPFLRALLQRNKDLAALLLRKGADPNFAIEEGSTILHILCDGYYDVEPLKILFEICNESNQPLQVDARNNGGKTPLQLAVAKLLPDTVDVLLDHGADLPKGLFPTLIDSNLFYLQTLMNAMKTVCGALAVAERLEAKGYDFSLNDALTIMKYFAKNDLFKRPAIFQNRWYDDEKFASKAKETTIVPSLSLYDLLQLRPEEEERRLTYLDYFRFANWKNFRWLHHNDAFIDACILHLCDKLSRGFFQCWALDPLWELIHKRLPIECCEMILKKLDNQDLYNICLAAAGQTS